ncbi:hypothetical protein [Antribacter gilvus]|uniref:hypothetical protein n=1 Tax=Antribacter gilvus TaxID=2304675 RepID=UPI000F77E109|nr:hypothetical protein [Antribacter gilvus]
MTSVVTHNPRSHRRLPRPELMIGIGVGLIVVLLVVVVIMSVQALGDDEPVVRTDASALTDGTCAEGLAQPTWVPAAVLDATVECPDEIASRIGYLSATDRLGTWVVYSLDGVENAEALPGDPADRWSRADAEAGAIHPATTIVFVVYPGATEISEKLRGQNLIISDTDLGEGRTARLTRVDNNGYGPVRLEWADDDGSYLLLSVVGRTADGRSGPTVEELVRMAESVNPER